MPVSVLKGSLHFSILSLLLPVSASAANLDWINSGISNWTNGSNWSGGQLPTTADSARIGNGGTAILGDGTTGVSQGVYVGADSGTGYLQISGGSLSSNFGIIGHEAAGVGTVSFTSGTWQNAANISVGYRGSGTMNFSGGQLKSNEVTVGEGVSATGTLKMTGGILQLTDKLSVGDSGIGTLNFSGGSLTAPVVNIGEKSGASGTITLSGTSEIRGILTTDQVRKGNGSGCSGLMEASCEPLQSRATSSAGSVPPSNLAEPILTASASISLSEPFFRARADS